MKIRDQFILGFTKIKSFYHQKPLIFVTPLIILICFVLYWFCLGQYHQSTDNAYVKSNLTAISPQVEGYIKKIYLDEGAVAQAGDIIIKIDDERYIANLIIAEQQLAQAQANFDQLDNKLASQQLNIPKSQSHLDTSQSELSRMHSTYNRSQDLAKRKYLSAQDFDKAKYEFVKAKNDYSSDKISLEQANLDLQQIKIERTNALSKIKECEAKLAIAQINLRNTVIRAPANGIIAQRSHSLGEFVVPGTILTYLVPLHDIWVIANFKETQVARMQVNQKVTAKIDAFNGQSFEGKVIAISPAAGSEFSLLPADNATGNFTKIVQRVSVKIQLYNPKGVRIVPGMSASVTVNTNFD